MPKIGPLELTSVEDFDFRLLIKALGKGEKGSRSLTFAEASLFIQGFANGKVTKAQMASAMMLMRVRGETVAEVAGVVAGLKHTINPAWEELNVDIDWPVYAGKREQLPWLLLVAKLLASKGWRVMLHGDSQALPHRRHVESCIQALDIAQCRTAEKAQQVLDESGIVYVSAGDLAPVLDDCRLLHQELGLRSIIQTASRCMNPSHASLSLRSFFHPGLDELHQKVAETLFTEGVYQPGVIGIFKGLQGETEINPRVTTDVRVVNGSGGSVQFSAFELPTLLEGFSGAKVGQAELSAEVLAQLWRTDNIKELSSRHNNESSSYLTQPMTLMSDAMLEQALSSVQATLCLVLSLDNVLQGNNIALANKVFQSQQWWAGRLMPIRASNCDKEMSNLSQPLLPTPLLPKSPLPKSFTEAALNTKEKSCTV
ncbi:glycosyl transferase [Shewanella sp. HL-SH8]|uniref:glycosyl transferase n=1 Tax=Shewanella sp. HL-SH8 TaxID=3436242 RepID=UPI003EBADFD4